MILLKTVYFFSYINSQRWLWWALVVARGFTWACSLKFTAYLAPHYWWACPLSMMNFYKCVRFQGGILLLDSLSHEMFVTFYRLCFQGWLNSFVWHLNPIVDTCGIRYRTPEFNFLYLLFYLWSVRRILQKVINVSTLSANMVFWLLCLYISRFLDGL